MSEPAACPVCRASAPLPFMRVGALDYWRCGTCEARFLDGRHYLSPEEELAHYRNHQNVVDDPGYRRFLSKLATPLLERIAPGSRGLDYGCGPGPALGGMLREAGHEVALYDPFFRPNPAPLAAVYDFIACTEVAEHFHNPADEFGGFERMLAPGGWLGVMTCFQAEDAQFANWHYRRDPTHVVFYREATFRVIAAQRGWSCEIPAKDVALMRKPMLEQPR